MNAKPLVVVLAILFSFLSWGQNSHLDYNRAVKMYNLTSYEKFSTSNNLNDSTSNLTLNSTGSSFQLFHPTVAFQWKSKNNNFHEIELTHLIFGKESTLTELNNDSINFNQTIDGGTMTQTHISARYEFILNFNKSKEHKIVPSIGFGINPYYSQDDFSPKTSSSFATSEKSVGIKTFITPRLTYFLTSKLFLDVNIPVCLFDLALDSDTQDNPIIPIEQRTVSTFNFNQFPNVFSGRIGIGFKF